MAKGGMPSSNANATSSEEVLADTRWINIRKNVMHKIRMFHRAVNFVCRLSFRHIFDITIP